MLEAVTDIKLRTIALVAIVVLAVTGAVYMVTTESDALLPGSSRARSESNRLPPAAAAAAEPLETTVAASSSEPALNPASPSDVTVEIVGSGSRSPAASPISEPPAGAFVVQAGAFKTRSAADAQLARLKADGLSGWIEEGTDDLKRVLIGPFEQKASADKVRSRLQAHGVDGFVRRLP